MHLKKHPERYMSDATRPGCKLMAFMLPLWVSLSARERVNITFANFDLKYIEYEPQWLAQEQSFVG